MRHHFKTGFIYTQAELEFMTLIHYSSRFPVCFLFDASVAIVLSHKRRARRICCKIFVIVLCVVDKSYLIQILFLRYEANFNSNIFILTFFSFFWLLLSPAHFFPVRYVSFLPRKNTTNIVWLSTWKRKENFVIKYSIHCMMKSETVLKSLI